MDINVVRIAVTIGAFAAFVAVVWWAYLPSRRDRLQAEAQRIVDEADL